MGVGGSHVFWKLWCEFYLMRDEVKVECVLIRVNFRKCNYNVDVVEYC